MSSDDTIREALRLDHLSKLHSLALPTLAGLQTKRLAQLLEDHLNPAESSGSRSSRPSRQLTRKGLWADQSGSSQHASSSHSVANGRDHRRRRAHPGARLHGLLPKWNAMHNARCRTCGIVLIPGINATIRFKDDVVLTTPTKPEPNRSSSMNTRREKRTTICEHCGARQNEQKGRRSRATDAQESELMVVDGDIPSKASAAPAASTPSTANESLLTKERPVKPSTVAPHPAEGTAPTPAQPPPAEPGRSLTLDERIAQAKAERKRQKREQRGADPRTEPSDPPLSTSTNQESALPEGRDSLHRTQHEDTQTAKQQQPETESTSLKRPLTLDERAALAKAERKRQKKEKAASTSSFLDGGKAGLRALLDAEKNKR